MKSVAPWMRRGLLYMGEGGYSLLPAGGDDGTRTVEE